jgi:AcrR family transcriptional regulator
MRPMNVSATPASSADAAAERQAARERLLLAGLRLFAHQGFAKTSTRELAEAAGVNVAAISYYFGDKAGLYRAAFFEPLCGPAASPPAFGDPGRALDDALRGFFQHMLASLKEGDRSRLCMKLRFREMLEPTGLWDEELAQDIVPLHDALVRALARHFGEAEAAAGADDELKRLAICIAGLAVHLHVGRDIVDTLAPALNAGGDAAVDRWAERLVMYARAMVDAEAQRRHGAGAPR